MPYPFLGRALLLKQTKKKKVGTLILSSLLEHLAKDVGAKWRPVFIQKPISLPRVSMTLKQLVGHYLK